MNEEPSRPDPDVLLSQIEAEDKKSHRGRLKIFFGSSAGVGKTFAMLVAAREQMELGRDVLVGIVETHSRHETESLLEGLRILQPLEFSYRGIMLNELDLETALTRKPDLLLVDELAHTNAPWCRHPKRWNDVTELLDAGIDVYTTLNVQHIESLSDLVSGTTGIWIKEIVPDQIFDLADDVVLVDLDEDDLLKRLQEGKVYVAEGAKARAAENFFKKSNLSALRELALRRMADRVDAERSASGQMHDGTPIAEKILVSISLNSFSVKLLRTTKRMAGSLKAPWVAVYVDDSGLPRLPEDKARYLESLEHMVDRMGGKSLILRGSDVAEEVTLYARKNHFSKIVVGKDLRYSFHHLLRGYLVDRIIRKSGTVDIYVVTDERATERESFRSAPFEGFQFFDYALALLMVVAFSIPGFALSQFLAGTDQALLYFSGIVLVAKWFGFGPSIFYSFLASVLYTIFFINTGPIPSATVNTFLMTFGIMTGAGLLVAQQVSRLHAVALSSREKEGRTRALYMLTRALAATRGRFPVADVVAQFLRQSYDVDATVWMTNSEGRPSVLLGTIPEETYYKDFGALQWCFENGQPAGRDTTTMPSALGFYIPLISAGNAIGVIGVFPQVKDRTFTHEEASSFETIASLLASALDRVRAAEIAQQVMVDISETKEIKIAEAAEVKQPPSASSSEHLMPVKLIRMQGTVSTMQVTPPDTSSMATPEQSVKIAQNFLSFFQEERAKSAAARLNRRPASLLERLAKAKAQLEPEIERRRIELNVPLDLPDVLIDVGLIDQALRDLLSFCIRRSPPLSTLSLDAHRAGSNIEVAVLDKGPSLPDTILVSLFESYDLKLKDSVLGDLTPTSLSVTAGIIRLHGGTISARNRSLAGLQITFTLPIA